MSKLISGIKCKFCGNQLNIGRVLYSFTQSHSVECFECHAFCDHNDVEILYAYEQTDVKEVDHYLEIKYIGWCCPHCGFIISNTEMLAAMASNIWEGMRCGRCIKELKHYHTIIPLNNGASELHFIANDVRNEIIFRNKFIENLFTHENKCIAINDLDPKWLWISVPKKITVDNKQDNRFNKVIRRFK